MKLSDAQRRELQAAADHPLGLIEDPLRNGFGRSGWAKMLKRLEALGLVREYVHGGYEITSAGRDALKIKCVACDGEGKRQIFDQQWMYGARTGRETCPDCDGKGWRQ